MEEWRFAYRNRRTPFYGTLNGNYHVINLHFQYKTIVTNFNPKCKFGIQVGFGKIDAPSNPETRMLL